MTESDVSVFIVWYLCRAGAEYDIKIPAHALFFKNTGQGGGLILLFTDIRYSSTGRYGCSKCSGWPAEQTLISF